jgi:glutamate transport system permease protein
VSTLQVLYDAPGPKTRARHRIYAVVSAAAVVGFLSWVGWRLYEAGEFEYDKWEVFITPSYIEALLVDGLLKTIQMAFLAILGAVVLGFMLGVGKLSERAWVRWPSWAIVEFFRAMPVLLLMIFIWYTIGIQKESSGYWAVVIALTLYNGSVLAEVLRAGVLAVPRGQAEAAYAIGMRKSQVLNIVLLPQAVKIMLPALISQCVVALKDTALGIAVTAPGLPAVAKQIYTGFGNRVPAILVVAAMFIIVNMLLTWLATLLQKKLVGEKKPPLTVPMVGQDGGAGAIV